MKPREPPSSPFVVGVVALVGGRERVVVDPVDGVRLAPARDRVVELDQALALRAELLLGRVDVAHRRRCRPGSRRCTFAVRTSTITRWLFSWRLTTASLRRLMSTNSGSGSSGASLRQAGERDGAQPQRRQVEDLQRAGRQLRDQAVVDVLVALVLDHDRRVALVGRDGDGVGLAGEREPPDDLPRGEVDDRELAARVGEALGGVDGDERPAADRRDARRLAAHVERAAGLRVRAAGDVDEADPPGRASRCRSSVRPPGPAATISAEVIVSAGSPGRRLAGTSNVPTWSYVAAAGAASTANAAAASNPVPKRKPTSVSWWRRKPLGRACASGEGLVNSGSAGGLLAVGLVLWLLSSRASRRP